MVRPIIGGLDVDVKLPGGGHGRKVTARVDCENESAVGYRGVADVDLPGIVDPFNKAYSTALDLNCYPDP